MGSSPHMGSTSLEAVDLRPQHRAGSYGLTGRSTSMKSVVVTAFAVSALAVTAAIAGCGGAVPRQSITARVVAAAPSGAATPGTQPAQPGGTAAPAQPGPAPLPGGHVGTLAQVPWAQIGPGWALAAYTTGTPTPPGRSRCTC